MSDAESFAEQLAYLREHSPFYRDRIDASVPLDRIHELPLTTKQELRDTVTADNPFGAHYTGAPIVRIYSTSGTTGTPSYIPLTGQDLDNWITGSARSYGASGIQAGERIVSTYNAGPFVAGAALASFDRLGLTHIPIGTGNTDRVLRAIEVLKPDALVTTPSYAAYLAERIGPNSVRRVLVAGEPGGGEPTFRAALEEAWDAKVTEAMGIGDIGVSLWGECEQQDGMHLGAHGLVHPELIDPDTTDPIPLEDGGTGELVLSHLKHRAAPLLRFRTRDHVVVRTNPCPCGRSGPRIRCIGRTDDMLIVRGVNVFPSALREVVSEFRPDVSGQIRVKPTAPGVKQEPPLPIVVEAIDAPGLADSIRERIRSVLVVQTTIELVPFGTLERSDYKSKLVER
jgi:phenylacetate-CoA ligase